MRIVALLCLCLASVSAQENPSSRAAPTQTNEQKARAIVEQMIQALGGQAYLSAQDYFAEMRTGSFQNETLQGWNLAYRFWKWPNIERDEITRQRDVIRLYLADKAYEITNQGIQPLNPEKDERVKQALQRRYYSLENVLREWLKEPGVLLVDEGPSISDGQTAEKITIINSKNESVTILVSPDNHLPVEKRFSVRDPRYRNRDEEATIYSNWKVIQGINTPRILLTRRNGETIYQEIVLNIAYNTHPAETLFDPLVAKINPIKADQDLHSHNK
jgi:hypothetical protein